MSTEAYGATTSERILPGSVLSRVKAVAGAGIGNVLEWYDFTVYAYLAGILSTKFFVTGNESTALLATFAVFGVGFVARPLGGLLIGLFGDKYGRKPALLLTFMMIAGSTGLMGILPTYASIGIAAPILLVVARLVQGISAGGEWGGAASFLVEWAPPHRRGLYGSLHPLAITTGMLLGSGVTGGLTSLLGSATMADWGWRLPFLFGALIGPLGLYVRSKVDETPVFRRAQNAPQAAAADFSMTRTMLLAFAFPAVQSVVTYVFVSYFTTFTQKYAGLSASTALWSTALGTLVQGLACVASGWLSDKTGRKFNMLASCTMLILFSYPLLAFALSGGASPLRVILVQSAFTALNGLFLGSMPAALAEMFPTSRRLTGLTTAYNLQSMVFGGFAPFIASWLITQTGEPMSLSYFIMFSAVVSGAALLLMAETMRKELT